MQPIPIIACFGEFTLLFSWWNSCLIGFKSWDWLGKSKTFHFFTLQGIKNSLIWTGRVFWLIVLMQYEALPNESGGIFLNIGRQDSFVPFQIHSATVIIHSVISKVPETAMHAHTVTPPPPCFTDEAVCLGSFEVPFLSPHFCFPIT